MKLQKKYMLLKATTIALGALSIPWGTFTGFCFGEGRYFTALVSLCSQTMVSLADGYIWFWVLENMRTRLEKEAKIESGEASTGHGIQCPLHIGGKLADTGTLNATYPLRNCERPSMQNSYSVRRS